MLDALESERPEPRDAATIFEGLRRLAQSQGSLHNISSIIYRDLVIIVDTHEGKIVDSAKRRWSASKLSKNELLLLVGLMVQSKSDVTYSFLPSGDDFAIEADRLLREFHDCVLAKHFSLLDVSRAELVDSSASLGSIAREAIYYGADSFYLHHFAKFARHRYKEDADWLRANAGMSIRPILEIAKFIIDRINLNMTQIGSMAGGVEARRPEDLTNSLIISKSAIIKKFGQKGDAFLSRFSTLAIESNIMFDSPFSINQVGVAPLIDIGDHVYIPNIYKLAESIYESPFYWMMADEAYRNVAAEHRGSFLERTVAHIFRSVFGTANVFENVTIRRNKREIAGEADVLVVYGEFVIVVQAKSKRITLKARAGDGEVLKADFEGAIHAPYRQAYEFAELILTGVDCITKSGKVLNFKSTVRVFPAVILSDAFPGATLLSDVMLERTARIAPVIWDIANLDCVARILPTPVEFLYYLKCRSDVFDSVHSESEYNFLGYHLRAKLVLPSDINGMLIDRDFATVVDDFMIASDVGVESRRPVGILETLEIPLISDLFKSLKQAPPELASVITDLYDFSGFALKSLSTQILSLREEVSKGKELKALSILTQSGGLTYAVCRTSNSKTKAAAEAIGSKHKYDSKRDRWYVILDSIATRLPIDALLPILGKWEENEELAERSRRVSEIFKSAPMMIEDPQADVSGSNVGGANQ